MLTLIRETYLIAAAAMCYLVHRAELGKPEAYRLWTIEVDRILGVK